MSQNKTIISGLDPDGGAYMGNVNNPKDNYYTRATQPACGTIVPNMTEDSNIRVNKEHAGTPSIDAQNASTKPIVGFLYSVSRTPLGEFWPLQIGKNSIGQASMCDICLLEGTVSSNHAVLVTRQVANGLIAAVTDSQSTNGTKINGEPIGFTPVECHDGDIITIGNNYELLLILIDVTKLGLNRSNSFLPVELSDTDDVVVKSGEPYSGSNMYRPTTQVDNYGMYTRVNGTVGFDGSFSEDNKGGTIPM